MSKSFGIIAAALIALGTSAVAAHADACSGRSHTKGTVLGAVGGGAIGGLAGGGAGGVIGGAVIGGLAGNAISRHNDCANQPRGYYHNGRYYEHRRYGSDGRYHYW